MFSQAWENTTFLRCKELSWKNLIQIRIGLIFIKLRRRAKTEKHTRYIFFVDDYQFERCWSALGTYTKLLEQFNYVCTPDFSLYIDMPKAIQIYNHYRKHYLGAYWQSKGIKVLPTIAWSDKSSYDFCFDGEPKNSVVVTSTVGILSSDTSKRLFLDGYREMKERLNPSLVICYGRIPDGLLGDDRVINIPAFYEQTAKRCKMHDAVKKAFKS